MKSLPEFITAIQGRIAREKNEVAQFATKLASSANPGYEMNWSQNVFAAAAKVEVYSSLLAMAEAVNAHTDEQWLEYSSKDFPSLPTETKFAWFRRYMQFQAPSKMQFSTGSMPTGNLYQTALNACWKEVATDYFSVWSDF